MSQQVTGIWTESGQRKTETENGKSDSGKRSRETEEGAYLRKRVDHAPAPGEPRCPYAFVRPFHLRLRADPYLVLLPPPPGRSPPRGGVIGPSEVRYAVIAHSRRRRRPTNSRREARRWLSVPLLSRKQPPPREHLAQLAVHTAGYSHYGGALLIATASILTHCAPCNK